MDVLAVDFEYRYIFSLYTVIILITIRINKDVLMWCSYNIEIQLYS